MFYVLYQIIQEPMDTSEPMKSETPQPAVKEQSPQKEQIENNVTGMSTFYFFYFSLIFAL